MPSKSAKRNFMRCKIIILRQRLKQIAEKGSDILQPIVLTLLKMGTTIQPKTIEWGFSKKYKKIETIKYN